MNTQSISFLHLHAVLVQIVSECSDFCEENPLMTESTCEVAFSRLESLERLFTFPDCQPEFLELVFNARNQIVSIYDNISPDIESLKLTVRLTSILIQSGIYTVRQLVSKSEIDLLRLPNLGKRQLTEIKDVFSHLGLSLSPFISDKG